MTKPLCFLVLVPCVLASVTLPVHQLFQNTLKRWNIKPLHSKDRLERWNRFLKAVKSVEETTSDIFLESLNSFTVLNDGEYDTILKPIIEKGLNLSESLFDDDVIENHYFTKRDRRTKRDLPEQYDYWEKTIGLTTPGNQMSCGSCWSFPNVGTLEALTKKLSGESIKFSEQYFVDCTFDYSGCAGGTVNEGFKLTMMRQYLLSWKTAPYTADYAACKWTAAIESGSLNAMTKIWGQDFVPLGKDEESLLKALTISPVSFGSYISDNIFGYSGGLYDDSLCATQALAHSMMLVGYTQTYLRVKASYGAGFGDKGYINYKRGSQNLPSCRFYDTAFAFTATYRREMQYEWCGSKKTVTRSDCKKSCLAMNTETETGWTLASIPTRMHNVKVIEMITASYSGVKTDEKFANFWIGLEDLNKDSTLEWIDPFIPVNYVNITNFKTFGWGKMYGTINKNTGGYTMKSSLTAVHRGLCGRAVTCWDISSAVQNGDVTFDRVKLTEGTVGTAKCDSGYSLKGSSTLTCAGGLWNKDLPTCTQDKRSECQAPTISGGTVSPSTDISTGSSYSVTCSNGYTIKGSKTISCTDNNGQATLSALPTCEKDAVQLKCQAPTISGGTVSPSTAISTGSSYSVTCSNGYTIKGPKTISCTDNNGQATLSALPTCEKVPVCSKPVIASGVVTPADTEIGIGGVYTVTCNAHHKLKGEAEMTCSKNGDKAVLSAAPVCEEETCDPKKAKITDGTIISGEKERYVYGDKVKYRCNDNFVIEGNNFIVCKGSKFSSSVPVCIAINTKCDQFTVTNGKLSNQYPYFATDKVRVTCATDYILSGTNPRRCLKKGWGRDAPTCTKDDGGQCISLTAPQDGTISCSGDDNGKNVANTKCTVGCLANFQAIPGSVTETTCKDKKFLWTHQDRNNPQGVFAPCNEMIAPAAKKLKSKVTIGGGAVYCQNDSEKALITTAVGAFLKDSLSISCLLDGKCEVSSVDCQYNKVIILTFFVAQTKDMLNKEPLKDAKTKIKNSVKSDTFTLSVNDGKRRKKRATTLSAESDSLETKDEVTCAEGEVIEDGVCVKCPAGYKTVNGTCQVCEIGTYNAAQGAIDCIACEGDKTTYGTGSTKVDQCYDLCTVPDIAGGSLNKEAGFKVEPTYTLTLTCDETYSPSVASFQCSSYSANTHKCNPLKQCKSADLTIVDGVMSGDTAPYEQGEKVTFVCNNGFKLVGNKVLTCNNRVWSNASPLCKPINTKCSAYKVKNGEVEDSSSTFVTTESVGVKCDYGYDLSGTNPRVCEDAGWKTVAQTCVKNEGKCPTLSAPDQGSMSCTGTNNIKDTCTVSCKTGYTYLGENKKVTCQANLRWSHQSYTNSQGEFAACAQLQTPKSRVLDAELYLDVDYCKTDQEKAAVVSAFEFYIKSGAAAVPCLTGSKCTVQKTSCKNRGGSSIVMFELAQTGDLSSADASTLTSSSSKIKELVNTKAMSFDVTTSKKRATTKFTAQDGSYTGNVKTTCQEGFAQVSDTCITCPAGHHIPGGDTPVCNPCAVGTYSTAPNSAGCEKCASGLTTYGKGSTSSQDCKKLCKVPGVTHGSMSPPTGYNVAPDTLIKLTCNIGFVLDTGKAEFVCNTGPVPTCKEDGETEKVSGGGDSTTVIIVVVVVVLVVLMLGVVAIVVIRKRNLSSSTPNQTVRMTESKAPISGENGFSENVYDTAEQNI